MAPHAKKKATKSAPRGKLAGKTVAFVGKFGYRSVEWLEKFARVEGASIIDATAKVPDYLVAGRGQGGNPPAIVAKIQKKNPAVQVLDEADFYRLIVPTRDEFIAEFTSGTMTEDRQKHLDEMLEHGRAAIDLCGANLREANLYGLHLEFSNLDGVDLRNATMEYAHFPKLRGATFDKADISHVYLIGAEDCSFKNAAMTEAWFFNTHQWNSTFHYTNNDFSGAKIAKARGRKTDAGGSKFRDADLSEGEFEESNFAGADLSGANLTQVHLHKSNLADAKLAGANCFRADLRNVSLVNADLRKTDLREAVLTGADLTGANVAGANFAGANLAGAKFDGVDTSKAKNFHVQQPRTAGPKMRELATLAAQAQSLAISVELDLGNGERVVLHAGGYSGGGQFHPSASTALLRGDDKWGERERHDASSLEQGMLDAAARWSRGTIRLDTVAAKASKSPLKGKALLELATAAWCEARGVDPADIQKRAEADTAAHETQCDTMLAELKGGAAGIAKWNVRPKHERMKLAKLRPVDLSGANLSGVDLSDVDLKQANFAKANFKNAKILYGNLEKASFAEADLRGAEVGMSKGSGASFENAKMKGCKLHGFTLRDANFRGADLTKAKMSFVDLRGADLSTAVLDGVTFDRVDFDEKTKLPPGFVPPAEMIWKGAGPHPSVAKPKVPAAKPGTLDFDSFFQQLSNKVEAARIAKATSMLKAERFQLFAEVKDDSLVGVVKSQSSADLVYSCRLASDGRFACCTQNLNPCGGLRGALCKHLLVLVVGLTKAGQLDPATVNAWVDASKAHKPAIDKDIMSETFLRYKGAEAGEVDWRPTETIPEDYYAL